MPVNPDIQKRAEELRHTIQSTPHCYDCEIYVCDNCDLRIKEAIANALAAAEAAGMLKAFKSAIWACQNVERAYAGQSLHDACIDAIRRVAEKAGA